jgi:hypothetical protein
MFALFARHICIACSTCLMSLPTCRQGKARQGKARQSKARQGKAKQSRGGAGQILRQEGARERKRVVGKDVKRSRG